MTKHEKLGLNQQPTHRQNGGLYKQREYITTHARGSRFSIYNASSTGEAGRAGGRWLHTLTRRPPPPQTMHTPLRISAWKQSASRSPSPMMILTASSELDADHLVPIPSPSRRHAGFGMRASFPSRDIYRQHREITNLFY